MTGPPVELAGVVGLVRRQAADLDALEVAVTWRTSTGEMQVDFRAGDYVRITFAGDAPARQWLLPPEWGAAS